MIESISEPEATDIFENLRLKRTTQFVFTLFEPWMRALKAHIAVITKNMFCSWPALAHRVVHGIYLKETPNL
eukprot:scaffold60133_cov39-Prasinocladus_malaysianus.AAC.1